ncbi:GTPase-activating protein [Lithospermum erythrorhizon]|uniref:GTPase-activating protein n=1 Tax=Lithospermum erythrorhizon TaxID=34254 RepID=A0AAV3NRT0_LITER
MPRPNKEDARVEKIIRGLLKLPENKRCINCNSLGPQYVCTTFWTFICTNCSGIHREFTHRVKSVSMATFSMEEVNALKAGGNERAREIYFRTLDAHRSAVPDGSNLHRLRDFIKHVYVDRKYTDEEGSDKLAMVKRDAVDDCKDKHSGAERSNQLALVKHSGHNSSERSTRKSRDEVSRHDSTEKPTRSARDAFVELFSNGPFSERPREVTRDQVSPYSTERSQRGARDDFLGRTSFERPRGIGRNDISDRHSLDAPSKWVRDDFMERHSFEHYSQGARDEFPERNSRINMRNRREDVHSRNYFDEGRSPSYKQEDAKSRSRKPRFEIVDDRFRDDDNRNARHFESIKYSNTRHSVGNASPGSQRQREVRKPLAICPAEEALDKKFPPLKAGESPRSIDDKCSQEFPPVQKKEGDPNPDSTIEKENEGNKETPSSLLDSDSKPETASTTDVDEKEKTSSVDEPEKKTLAIVNVDAPTSTVKEASVAQNVTPLESLLLDWPAPSNTTPGDSTSTMSNVAGYIPSDSTSNNQSQTDSSIQTIEALPDTTNDLRSEVQQGVAPVVAQSNQEWSSAPATNDNGSLVNHLSSPSPQANFNQALEFRGTNESQNSQQALVSRGTNESQNSQQALGTSGSDESQASKRKELPADLFSGGFEPFPARAPVPGWQLHQPHLMGYGMQYQPAVPMCMPPFAASPAPRNPFDIGGDGTQIAAQQFSHIPSLPVAQPNMIVPAGFHNQEPSHAFSWQAQQYPYGMAAAPGSPYDTMNNSNADAFASLNATQQFPGTHSTAPPSNNSSTTGGNPFG